MYPQSYNKLGPLMLVQIFAAVSVVPQMASIASLVVCRFSMVPCRCGLGFFSLMPLYAVDWVIVASVTPCISNSVGIWRSSSSCCSFLALSFVSLSLSSFPFRLLWPFTQVKDVLADLRFNRYAAIFKSDAFWVPIPGLPSCVNALAL